MTDPDTEQTVALGTEPIRRESLARESTPSAAEGRFVSGTLVAGRYRVISLLGRGGMGEVYRATDLMLAQPVALKFLPPSSHDNPALLERFYNEVRVARQVSHPNVCRVYDLGEAEGAPYISMEYVDGEDLDSLLQRIGRLPADKAVEIARKICAGIAAAHDRNVIHRDLKPANIMIDRRGNAVVMDFGLSAVANALHGSEARSGTPAYMAPEQLRGEEVTAKSDVYALGLVLYQLFTGRRAYEARSHDEMIRLQESAEFPSMSSIAADIDPAVENAIRRCLDPKPERRPASALAVSALLPGGDPLAAALAAGETPSPELVAASGKMEGLTLRRSVPIALTLAILILAVPFARYGGEMHTWAYMDLSPDALAAKAREHATAFGYHDRPADSKYDLHWNWPLMAEQRNHRKSEPEASFAWFKGEPPTLLSYRQSPVPLLAEPDGQVTEERPAPLVSGMIEAWVNGKGELRNFRAVPLQSGNGDATSSIDAQLLAKASGLPLSEWREGAPVLTPLYAFDWARSWAGKHPALGLDVTVQASAWRGRVTEFSVVWPWSKPDRMPEQNWPYSGALPNITRVLSVATFLFSAFLAVRNLRAGRGDRRGAMRLAWACLLLSTVIWACKAHWIAHPNMMDIVTNNAASWLTAAASIWLLYIALEPAVRSRWPRSLVTWNRVLVGQWKDPLVGAHVLYGALTGALIAWVFLGNSWYQALHGRMANVTRPELGVSARLWIADVLTVAWSAVSIGLVVIFSLFLLRLVCRRDWVAAIVAALLMTAREGDVWRGEMLVTLLYVVIFTALMFVILRLGLVSTIVAVSLVNLLTRTPGPQDFTKFYEWTVIAYPAVALAVVAWGFWTTSGERVMAVEAD